MRDGIYLDNNATTPLRPEAKAAMLCAMEAPGNPSSVHGFGQAQRRIVEDARERVAKLAGVKTANVIFTSGGSEANNTILNGIVADHILTTSVEHASVLDAVPSATILPVDKNGTIHLDELRAVLSGQDQPALLSVMAANNETGVIQPIESVAEIAREFNAKLHVDAIQAAGKIDLLTVAALADAISLSAHKLGGPQGVGAIIVRDGVPFEPLVKGGGQERRRRAGTENVIGIAGFGAAAEAAMAEFEAFQALADIRDGIETALAGDAMIYGKEVPRLANTSCIGMDGVSAETQVMAFDLAGIAISAGSACSSGKVEPSHVLRAMGLSDEKAGQTIRMSLGWANEPSDASAFIDAWRALRARTSSEVAA
jgi:cysteine desulfurase